MQGEAGGRPAPSALDGEVDGGFPVSKGIQSVGLEFGGTTCYSEPAGVTRESAHAARGLAAGSDSFIH